MNLDAISSHPKFELFKQRFDALALPQEPHPEGCWIWRGRTMVQDNGQVRAVFGLMQNNAARAGYALYRGPMGKMFVCHKCDDPMCVNPWHMFLGTHTENMRDMVSKGRHGRSVLTVEQVLEMRASPLPNRFFADKYFMSMHAINAARRGLSWRHLDAKIAGS